MSNFFNDFSDKSFCRNMGMCSIDPSSYALEELLLNEIKQIAFYITKLKDFNVENNEIMERTIRALSVIIINTAIRFKDYKILLLETQKDKNFLKEIYLKCCKEKRIKYELVENAYEIPKNGDLSTFLKAGETLVVEKQKEYEPRKLGLIELVTIFAKTTCINLEKLRHYDYVNYEWNLETLKFLNLTNISTIKIEKLKRKIIEYSSFAFEIWKKLVEKITENYGERIEGTINLNIKEGKSILVSGSDFDELEKLLIAAKDKDINIYTNSALFMAFSRPKFLEYKNLIGHFGGENPEFDFTNFKGPIFTTQSFLYNLDYLRRGTIFTTKIIAPERMIRIENYDFMPLIENALKSSGFDKEDEKLNPPVTLKYNKEEIKNIIENSKNEQLCVIVGSYKKYEIIEKFKTKKVILLDSPIETDLLLYIAKIAPTETLEIVFTHCSVSTLNMLLSIISCKPRKIYFARCSNSLISPHVDNSLAADFNVELI